MNEREQAFKIVNNWLDNKMNALVEMVPGDPDCDACVLARQFIQLSDRIEALESLGRINIAARDKLLDRIEALETALREISELYKGNYTKAVSNYAKAIKIARAALDNVGK